MTEDTETQNPEPENGPETTESPESPDSTSVDEAHGEEVDEGHEEAEPDEHQEEPRDHEDHPDEEVPEESDGEDAETEEAAGGTSVGYINSLDDLEEESELDTVLYSEEPGEEFEMDDIGGDLVNIADEGSAEFNGVDFLYNDSDFDIEDPSILDGEVSVEEFYEEEELEDIADEMSAGIFSRGLNLLTLGFFGSSDNYAAEDLNLENIKDDYKNAGHKAYEEAKGYMEDLEAELEESGETVLIGDNIIHQMLSEEYENVVDVVSEEGSGMYEIEDGEVYTTGSGDSEDGEDEEPSPEEQMRQIHQELEEIDEEEILGEEYESLDEYLEDRTDAEEYLDDIESMEELEGYVEGLQKASALKAYEEALGDGESIDGVDDYDNVFNEYRELREEYIREPMREVQQKARELSENEGSPDDGDGGESERHEGEGHE